MSRRRAAEKRVVFPDPKFGSVPITKFVNSMMKAGKRSVAENILYSALELAQKNAKRSAMDVFGDAIKNVTPFVEVRSRRVGGATYQVPVEVRSARAQALAIRWIIIAARKRSEKTMTARLVGELLDACNNRGLAVKKREDTHKMADANKAFSHYKW